MNLDNFANQWLEAVVSWFIPVFFFLDLFFGGVTLRVLAVGRWYRGLLEGEQVVYRRALGCLKGGWSWGGLVMITNKRFVVRFLFSRLAVVDVPHDAIREAMETRWWWFRTVRVVYRRKNRERWIEIGSNRREQAELLQAFRSVGANVVGDHDAASR